MSGVINIQAEDLMCSVSGVSGGQDLIGFLLSTFLSFPKREVSYMLSITPTHSISLLSNHYGIAVPTNVQEQSIPRIWSHAIIKYMYTPPPSMITTEAPPQALLINTLMTVLVRCFSVSRSESIHLSLLQVSTFLWTTTAQERAGQ